jgi:putative oxidoreductase
MSIRFIARRWAGWGPQMQAILRIMAAITFMLAGTVKLFAFPIGVPPAGGTVAMLTEAWFAGILETFGGLLILLGLFTRPAAFVVSGEMAVAYFQYHAPGGFWPVANGGIPALLYCFIWLYFSAAGPGAWSLDGVRRRASGAGGDKCED